MRKDETTTIRVSRRTRDEVTGWAREDGISVDEELQLLLRRERQRRMGLALASWEPDEADRAVLDAAAARLHPSSDASG